MSYRQTLIEQRIIEEADHIISTKDTVRATAKVFGMSKSAVFKDMKEKLKELDYIKFLKVEKVLKENLSLRHVRGGIATKIKFGGKAC